MRPGVATPSWPCGFRTPMTRRDARSPRQSRDPLGVTVHTGLLADITGKPVEVGLPPTAKGRSTLYLHPLELREAGPARAAGWQPVDALAAHLVTATAPDGLQALGLLSLAALAAQEDRRVLCDLVPPPTALWQALGVTPRPSWTLLVPLIKPREPAVAPPVAAPLSIGMSGLVPINGQVLGGGGRPQAGIRLSAPGLGKPAVTDPEGRFRLLVPADARPTHLTAVTLRGEVRLALRPGDLPQTLVIPPPPET